VYDTRLTFHRDPYDHEFLYNPTIEHNPCIFRHRPFPDLSSLPENHATLHDGMRDFLSTETTPIRDGYTLLPPIEELPSSDDSFLSPTCVSYTSDEDYILGTATVSVRPHEHSAKPNRIIKRKITLAQSIRSLYTPIRESVPLAEPPPSPMIHGSKGHQFAWSERFHTMWVTSSASPR